MELHSITFPGLPEPYKVAPGGYGLGDRANYPENNDVHSISKSGWYLVGVSTQNAVGTYGLIQANVYDDENAVLFVYGNTGSIHARKIKQYGTWSEWEWVNPPMVLGVEYRTTERCEGKPVYAKRINCYAAPASVDISSSNIEKVVRWSGFVTYYGVALPCGNASWKVDINRNSISTTSAYDQASAHFYIDLYYTKS